MPQYNFTCSKCKNTWDKYYSFKEYDAIVLPKLEKCPDCRKKKFVRQTLFAPNINLNNTIGAASEKNTKNLGHYGLEKKIKEHEDALAKKNKNKKTRKTPWYGSLPKEKAKAILGEKDAKTKKDKINKYIMEGT